MRYNPNQIGLLIAATEWGPGGDQKRVEEFLSTAIAVCYAESGGDPKAKNPDSSASGLWQILVSVHTDMIAGRDIFDPLVNTEIARDLWKANGWQPWEAYTKKTALYKRERAKDYGPGVYAYLSRMAEDELAQATAALVGSIANPGVSVAGNAEAKFSPAGVLQFIQDSGKVVGLFLLALILLILGLWLALGKPDVSKATPVGIVKAAVT